MNYYSIISTYVRDDNDYLDEWVTYHLGIGFEHIVMYDHKSVVPVENIWGDKVSVVRSDRDSIFEPEYFNQTTLRTHKSYWMAMLDVDEFIVLFESKNINEFLKPFEEFAALGLPWSMYGSSGHITKPNGRVTDNYLWRRPDEPMWIKSIINTQYCTSICDPHRGEYGRSAVNEMREYINGPVCDSPRAFIKINHYFTRSYEEWVKKVERGTGNPNTPPRPMDWFEDIRIHSTVYDDVLKDFDKPKIWENISGWFNFHNFYTNMVGKFDHAIFVEVGCWEGKSTTFMAEKIKGSGKDIKFYAVDIWEDYIQEGMLWKANMDLFINNIEPVKEYINILKGDSTEAVKHFEDGTVDFVFIDGNHQYEFIKSDIEQWLPKMKKGGVLAGHDTQFEGVTRAINELLTGYTTISNYWMYDIKG
jgi:hypothetical protein